MLSEAHLKGLEARGLSVESATSTGLYSGRRSHDGSVVADRNGSILCLPFIEHGEEVNTKYRQVVDGERRMWQRPNAPKTFFNADALLDDASMAELECGTASLIITEGEFDVLAAVQCGFPHAVSVPNGAPPARDAKGQLIPVPGDTRDIDVEADTAFSYLARHMDRLMRVKTFVIATDGDENGKRLSKELVRRLGAARCRWIEYPADPVVPDKRTGEFRPPKDLNEVLKHMGADKVQEVLENSLEWPVLGLYRFSQYPDVGEKPTYEIGISPEMDRLMRFYTGAFIVTTGVPGMGKTTLMNQIAVNMARIHKWPVALFSGEADVRPIVANALMTAFLEKHRGEWSDEDRQRAMSFLERYFVFIDQDPETDEGEITLDKLLELAGVAVFRHGIKLLLVDPWNEVEHNLVRNFTEAQYLNEAIRKVKRFARSHDCAVCIVAHPTKMDAGTMPSLYSISGGAVWYNKAEIGIVVHAEDPQDTRRIVAFPKVKFSFAGVNHSATELGFDRRTELFQPPPF